MDARTQRIIDALGLSPHPEGGFFRETFRSRHLLAGEARSASTGIYFLLPSGTFSAFHVIHRADEVWHHYAGDPVEIHAISPAGVHWVELLGGNLEWGERPQIVVPEGTLQAAVPRGTSFALCGCTVAPGFDFADFEMPPRVELLRRFPSHEPLIRRLTRG